MKKKNFALTLLLCATLSLSACTSQRNSLPADSDEQDTQEEPYYAKKLQGEFDNDGNTIRVFMEGAADYSVVDGFACDFEVQKDGESVVTGAFFTGDAFGEYVDMLHSLVQQEEESGEDGPTYILKETSDTIQYKVVNSDRTEYGCLVWVPAAYTTVSLWAEDESYLEVFDMLSFEPTPVENKNAS